ncbi:putative cytosolic oligopeptidase A isoform X2 [Tasmannia lanceolata]|uniref:putative cytosolic oligopeptidase A isoform X2 n=1 Tax=Tasmannia lanceolata TaxID=3420 RepID=UPI0040645C86
MTTCISHFLSLYLPPPSLPSNSTTFTFSFSAPLMASQQNPQQNPLLQDFIFPPYNIIQPNHILTGIPTLLNKLESDLIELENTVEPIWPKLVVPLERIIDRLKVVWGIVEHLKSVKDFPELRSAIEQVQPEKVKFQLRLGQSKPIYNAFKAIQESSCWQTLNDAQKRIVEAQIKEAVLNGVSLEDDKRDQFNKIQQELGKLSQKFDANIFDATKNYEKLITDKMEVDGLPATALGLYAQTAISKGHANATTEKGPWIITLDFPCYRRVLQHARNRSLREEVYRAYTTRASNEDLDNTPIIDQILKLRLAKANILGYNNYAEVSMEMKMATVDKAKELLEELRIASRNAAMKDVEDLKSFSRDQGSIEATDLRHWDFNFWSERLRESKYDINEEELRPYFSLPKVMDGLFRLSKRLFNINIESADGLAPVWHKDVQFYCVKDSSSNPVAYFYFDPYSRPSEKRGGAGVEDVFSRSCALARDGAPARLPVVNMVCNQTSPVGNKPSLMTLREVWTVFHEFGHALQHMLTKQDESLVSGTRGIEWDAVELPSQFMENWLHHRDTLMSIAKHYETGENLREDIFLKLLGSRTFLAGSEVLRQLRFAIIDLELHTEYVPGGSESIYDIDQVVRKRTQVIPLFPEDRFLCSFSHIFADEYAAGYYSYQAIEEIGRKFRETVLALGGGKSPMEVFVEFRGREPSPEAFLRHNGLLPVIMST